MLDRDLIQQINTFAGGMNRDNSLENIPTNSYIDANDITAVATEENEVLRIKGLRECGVIPNPVSITYPTQQAFRARLDVSAPGIPHEFTFFNQELFATINFTESSALATPLLRFNELIALLKVDLTTISGGSPTIVGDLTTGIISITFINASYDYSATEQINNGPIENLILLQERFSVIGTPYYDIVGLKSIGEDLFLLISVSGTGMIAVAKKNEATGFWAATRLIQSKEIDLDRSRVYKIQLETNNDYINMYWVDGTIPKTFSIKKQSTWVTDSALKYTTSNYITATPDALYTYSSVQELTSLQIFNNTSYISNLVVNDTGGVFTNGNKQFAIRYKIGSSYTNFSVLSSPVSIVVRDAANYFGGGGAPDTQTSKSVTLTISNVQDDVYELYQVGVIQYSGGSVSAFSLGDFPVLGREFSVTISGNESPQSIDASVFNEIAPVITGAHLNELIENRYYLGRIEVAPNPDLADWSRSIFDPSNISIISESALGPLAAVGFSSSPDAISEYMDYNNTRTRVGYMYGEVYRFGIRWYLKNGLITPTYFGADIKIENDIQGNNGNLTNNFATEVYNYAPRIDVIDFLSAPTINGQPFLDVVEAFEIMRAPLIPNVIDTGYFLSTDYWFIDGDKRYIKTVGGRFSFDGTPYLPPVTAFTNALRYGVFISQGMQAGFTPQIQIGDTIKFWGLPDQQASLSNYSADQSIRRYDFREQTGFFLDSQADKTIEIVKLAEYGSEVEMDFDGTYKNTINQLNIPALSTTGPAGYVTNNGRSYAIKTTTPVTVGLFPEASYVHILRGLSDDRYGLETATNYISTGEFSLMPGDTTINNFEIYGGDTYTQKCYHRIAYDGIWFDGAEDVPSSTGVSYYAQNHFNAQAEYSTANQVFPLTPKTRSFTPDNIIDWITQNRSAQEARLYDSGFTYSNSVRTSASFNSDIPQITKQNNTIYYSDQKLEGDLSDPYRFFRLANSKTYEMSEGILTGLYRIRGNLAVLQEYAFRMQAISPNALINPNDIGDLILGTGSVLGTKDQSFQSFGAQKKTHSWYLRAKAGSEYVVFLDNDKKSILRYGPDGMKPISLTNLINNFLLNNTRYIQDEFHFNIGYNPYTDEVWFMANNPQGGLYNIATPYVTGNIVKDYPTDPDANPDITYEFFNQFEARENSTGEEPDLGGSNFNLWKPNRNTNFTLAFSERNNSFSTNYTLRPRINTVYKNSMISVFPFTNNATSARGTTLAEHDANAEAEYVLPFIKQTPYVEMSVSPQADICKRLVKMWINLEEGEPDRVVIEGDDGTAANITDFTVRRDRVEFSIPKDFYATGQRVGGYKIKVKLFFDYAKKIHNFVTTARLKDRKFNS